MSSHLPQLSLLETRVLGVLAEKQHTVPDSYPLTLNALVSGCNQKTSRDPVIEATESEVQGAIDRLKTLSLAMESSGGRVMRYAHNAGKGLGVPPQSVALLAILFLRGPQTAGELRINSDRLHKFGDILAVEGFLNELAERAMVRELAKQPGARETRWVHLLSGEPAAAVASAPSASGTDDAVTVSELATMKAHISKLEEEIAALRATVARLCKELGVSP
ncbi:MAG: YceH family protein [Burkholderiales bacterium]|nr:YceH family protein [Burkholderiales bacterium]